ncbi:hypothetical protein BTR22_19115 [Alkalihalophilus pseudofirmus]|uniref:hypothetical protein n=1 Tax=Alkalihalophilus pseudofirmus TaxID=79885 RepID=UPI000950EDA7|nr:hypothetical protein BTR22_19115 [Alkalihalophilus pseudofirmus]
MEGIKERKYDDDDIKLWGNYKPICPYCGEEQETTELGFESFSDGEILEGVECDHCEEYFKIELNLSIRYNTFVDFD